MIKFISYTGKWPNLCSGVLTVEIDSKEIKFGHDIGGDFDFKNDCYKDGNLEPFWVSGGCVRMNEDYEVWAEKGSWELRYIVNNYPQWIIDLLPKLLEVFNENVPLGCCGGCV